MTHGGEVCSCNFLFLKIDLLAVLFLIDVKPRQASNTPNSVEPSYDIHRTMLGVTTDHAGRLRSPMAVPWDTSTSPMQYCVCPGLKSQPLGRHSCIGNPTKYSHRRVVLCNYPHTCAPRRCC